MLVLTVLNSSLHKIAVLYAAARGPFLWMNSCRKLINTVTRCTWVSRKVALWKRDRKCTQYRSHALHARVFLPSAADMYVITVTASSLLLNTAGARRRLVSYNRPFDYRFCRHEIYNYTAARDVARNKIRASALRNGGHSLLVVGGLLVLTLSLYGSPTLLNHQQ